MKDDEILHKWINGNLSKEELEVFKLREEYPSLVELYKNTTHASIPSFDEDNMLSNILKQEKKSVTPTSIGRKVLISSWIKYGVAASILLFATWFFWPKNNIVKYELAQGQKMEGTLPDQSNFILNAESKLSYVAKDWKNHRTVELEGEAFFKVQKGETFEVVTEYGNVKVLGTQFNVFSRNKMMDVKCKSGKVAVLSNDNNVLTELSKGQAVRIINNEIVEEWSEDATNQNNWMKGIFNFKKVPLQIVLDELERQFEISIKTDGVNVQEILTCNFQNKDLKSALKTTISPLGLEYEIKEDSSVSIFKK